MGLVRVSAPMVLAWVVLIHVATSSHAAPVSLDFGQYLILGNHYRRGANILEQVARASESDEDSGRACYFQAEALAASGDSEAAKRAFESIP